MNKMHEYSLYTDDEVLARLGENLARHRIGNDLTQAMLAEQAGVSKRTIERMEAGETSQTTSLVRVLRVLGLLPGLAQLVPPLGPSPMQLIRTQGKPRQRARPRPASAETASDETASGETASEWHWAEDES